MISKLVIFSFIVGVALAGRLPQSDVPSICTSHAKCNVTCSYLGFDAGECLLPPLNEVGEKNCECYDLTEECDMVATEIVAIPKPLETCEKDYQVCRKPCADKGYIDSICELTGGANVCICVTASIDCIQKRKSYPEGYKARLLA